MSSSRPFIGAHLVSASRGQRAVVSEQARRTVKLQRVVATPPCLCVPGTFSGGDSVPTVRIAEEKGGGGGGFFFFFFFLHVTAQRRTDGRSTRKGR